MIFIKCFIFLIFICTAFLSMHINKDIFSPAKWFVLHFFIYFFDIYLGDYSFEDHLLVLLTIISISFVVFLDRPISIAPAYTISDAKKTGSRTHLFFYSLILIPVVAQFYIVYSFGGFYSYLNIVKMRVLEFRGMGPIIILTSLYTPIVLAYFGYLLISRNKHIDWFWFLNVFIGMVFINLLSGGRGTVLAPILSMIIIYHFIRRNIKIGFVITIAIILFSSAAILEVLRNQISVDDNQVQVFSEEGSSKASFEFTKYGLISSQLIMDNPINKYEYGTTYLTVLTNFIPRALWPGKPDTGGVILTNRYKAGVWNGASNLATGLAAEGMLNFGEGGLILVPFGILLIYFIISKLYKKIFIRNSDSEKVKAVLIYGVLSFSLVNLISGEFTNVLVKVFVSLIFIYFIFKCREFLYGKS